MTRSARARLGLGSRLEVTGRRLDGGAPSLEADVSPYYVQENFTPGGVGFPTAGCWELEARAAGSILRFVVEVYPRMYATDMGRCANLADVVENSHAILAAEAEASAPDRPGFGSGSCRTTAPRWRASSTLGTPAGDEVGEGAIHSLGADRG